MLVSRRSYVAVGVFLAIAATLVMGRWYQTHRMQAAPSSARSTVVHVTSGGDRGPGTLREALFIVAAATAPATVSLEVKQVILESALPALVNGRGVRVIAAQPGTRIDAQALNSGPVFDISGPNTFIQGIAVSHCPAAAFLVRAAHFQIVDSAIESCDVGVDVAENASQTLVQGNRFSANRLGVRFAASGRNAVVANNLFSGNKDAGLWAVRGSMSSHDEPIGVRDNRFTAERIGVVAGNIPVLVEKNEFLNAAEADVHIVGAGGVVRGNHISGGASMGIIAENASGAIIEDNEMEGLAAYGVMVRGSANTLVRGNRLHNCGYGLAFVLGDSKSVSTAVDNTIIEPKFNGIDVVGDSPILRRNQVLRPHAFALHTEDFQPPGGAKVAAQPFLADNNFGNSPISRGATPVAADAGLKRTQ